MSRQLEYILKRRLILTLLAFFSLVSAHLQAQETNDIFLTKAPKNNQLYPRDISTNLGTVVFEGTLDETISFDSLVLKHSTSNGASEAIKLTNSPNRAFSHSTKIEAELVDHTFEILSYSAGAPQLHYKAIDVVAGDAYLIYGQSNAQGGSTENNKHHFARTYGKSIIDSDTTNRWHALKNDKTRLKFVDFGMGVWGQQVVNDIIINQQIPVALINGATGGIPIQDLLAQKEHQLSPNNYYERWETRVLEAGLKNNIRAIAWWHGTADGWIWYCRTVDYYTKYYRIMNESWEKSFGEIKNKYIIQGQTCFPFDIRPECMIQIQESQRQYALNNKDTQILPIGHHQMGQDNCHFKWSSYESIGREVSNLMLEEIYGRENLYSPPPEVDEVYFTSCLRNSITVTFKTTSVMYFDNELKDDIRLENAIDLEIESIEMVNNKMLITLSSAVPIEQSIGLSHYSHFKQMSSAIGDSHKSVLQFYNLPIELPDIDKDGYSCLYDCDDNNPEVNPTGKDVSINGIDEDCDGYDGPYTSPEMELDIKTKVSPNPSHQFMSVYFGLISRYTLTLSDIDGTLLSTHQLEEIRETTLNLNHIKPGQYFLKIYNHDLGVSIVKRILKN
ncbi:sialate O-acetylesterase [Roseivirga pacifica]|uniref:sialate O-acetylesterase n=1 Tax=Roseivirga pacifica TaxID=1267423 RepID=UPI00227CF2EB|nr:sialate O-acetylesterase [Roseivirga pacifica]